MTPQWRHLANKVKEIQFYLIIVPGMLAHMRNKPEAKSSKGAKEGTLE